MPLWPFRPIFEHVSRERGLYLGDVMALGQDQLVHRGSFLIAVVLCVRRRLVADAQVDSMRLTGFGYSHQRDVAPFKGTLEALYHLVGDTG
eukprot:scaffold17932_cov126-Isochrysis_galbana.AAC.1